MVGLGTRYLEDISTLFVISAGKELTRNCIQLFCSFALKFILFLLFTQESLKELLLGSILP